MIVCWIKDNRLQQQELALKTETELLEKEKEKFFHERKRFETEIIEFGINNKEIESLKNSEKQLQDKLQVLYAELEANNKLMIAKEEERLSIEKRYHDQLAINREQEVAIMLKDSTLDPGLDEKISKLKEKKKKLKDLQSKVQADQLSLTKKKESFEDAEIRFAAEKKVFDDTRERVTDELESIDELKEILKIQEENLNRERKLMQNKYEEKLAYVEELKKKVNNRLEQLMDDKDFFSAESEDEKLKHLQESNEKLKIQVEELEKELKKVRKDKNSLQDRCAMLEETLQSLRKTEENLKIKNSTLEQDQLESKSQLESLYLLSKDQMQAIQVLKSQNQSLSDICTEYESFKFALKQELDVLRPLNSAQSQTSLLETLRSVSAELEIKSAEVKIKEEEYQTLKDSLVEERKSILSAADYIKTINDDLEIKQMLLDEEKSDYERKEMRIVEQDKKIQSLLAELAEKEQKLLDIKRKVNNF